MFAIEITCFQHFNILPNNRPTFLMGMFMSMTVRMNVCVYEYDKRLEKKIIHQQNIHGFGATIYKCVVKLCRILFSLKFGILKYLENCVF